MNGTASPVTVNVSISGVHAGQVALLLFSNGTETATTLPSAGSLGDPALASQMLAQALPGIFPSEPDAAEAGRDRADAFMRERNRLEAPPVQGPAAAVEATALAPSASPAVGDIRTWWDNYPATPVSYSAVAKVVCTLANGRNGIFWVDPASTAAGDVTDADLAYFESAFCGSSGGYARLVALRGEPWGRDAAVTSRPGVYIQDQASVPQDVHVVFLNVPPSTAWGGYFYGFNNIVSTYAGHSTSNEALAFFLNAPNAKGNRGYYASTLLHELTHMVNHYQRTLVKGAPFDTWLEEMSAMMTEDFLTPAVTSDQFAKVPRYRIGPYVAQGGAVSLIDWGTNVSSNPYPGVGSLGAFLNRRYGLSVYQGMLGCSTLLDGVGCANSLVVAAGGTGFPDELARMGATVYGLVPPAGAPAGYGYPQTTNGGYTFAAVDLTTLGVTRPAAAAALGTTFTAATHTYQLDAIAPGSSSYSRPSVVVPAGVTLLVVIQ